MATLSFIPPVIFHPGDTLSEKLKEMGMSIKEFAIRTSKPEKTIYAVINGSSSVTSDMAVAFESVTRIPANYWMSRQREYDEYIARQKRESVIERACDWAKMFPYAQMAALGWVAPCKTMPDKVRELFSFFQISTVQAWEDYYLNQQLKVTFRISLSNTKEPYAISAWLREGERQSALVGLAPYSEKALRAQLPAMKLLMVEQPDDFVARLKELCAGAGVRLLCVPCLQKAPINGATRWINDTPCILLTGRHKRNDIFWFTFFHEIGHILLHGKKDIFLEDIEYTDKQMEKEEEANAFASKLLLTSTEEEEVISSGDFSVPSIRRFAKKFNTHPAIIVGRLQHKKIVPYTKYTNLIVKVDLFGKTKI